MQIKISKTCIEVIKEPSDKKIYGVAYAKGESRLLYAIIQKIKAMGYDCIKKRMWKDGHLVDDMQQYIRARNGDWCAFNDHWAINGLEEDFNEGKAVLTIAGDISLK